MKYYILSVFVLLLLGQVTGQETAELYLEVFDTKKYAHISIENRFGNIYVDHSADELEVKVEFSFDEEVSIQATKLKGKIAIERVVRNDSIILITVLDDEIFKDENLFSQIKENINIHYRVVLPRKASACFSQEYGDVVLGRSAIPISIRLKNANLFAEYSEHLDVVGDNFKVEASDVKNLHLSGSNGQVNLNNVGIGKIKLRDSETTAKAFGSLELELNGGYMSSGPIGKCEVVSSDAVIDFEYVSTESLFTLVDTRLLVKKAAENTQLKATGGSIIINLMRERNCKMNVFTEDSNFELYLNGCNLEMDYFKKKNTKIDFPLNIEQVEDRVELDQRRKYGVEVAAKFVSGSVVIKK